MVVFEVWNGAAWVDWSHLLRSLKHRVPTRGIEELHAELFLQGPSVGQRVRYRRNNVTRFEGVVYEVGQRHEGGRTKTVDVKAYTDLVLYDRHVVFREYAAGVKAGFIVKDIASLETSVDVSNVDESNTPALTSPWTVENVEALRVLMDVARGVNYWLRMRPGKKLYFKPKTAGTPSATLDGPKCVSVEYSEDRWRLRNRVIYVGSGGRVLADVSEGAGDMPMTVHDPFLTNENEALRRAQTRLQLNREHGRSLRAVMMQDVFESLNVDLGDTVAVNLPSLGLNTNMYVVEIEYDPAARRYTVTLGGRLELFEDFLSEVLEGDIAARFGRRISIPEYVSSVVSAQNAVLKLQADARTLRLVNRPPMVLSDAVNVVLNDDGHVVLASGHTSGSFITWALPTDLFSRWLRVFYSFDTGGGNVLASIVAGDGSTVVSNIPADYEFGYFPSVGGWLTEQNANEWFAVNSSLSDSENAVISRWSIRAVKTGGGSMKIFYPKTMNQGLSLTGFKHLVIYLYSLADDPGLKIRLMETPSKYHEATVNHQGLAWRRYQIKVDTMNKVGGGASTLNWLEIETMLPILYVDSDYVLVPAAREKIGLKISLSRPSASAVSPKVLLAKLVWREGG